MIAINYLTPKQFKSKHGNGLGVHFYDDKGNHFIDLPYHASTLTRCHELAHAYSNDITGVMKLSEYFECEVRAEVNAWQYTNKPLNYNVVYPAVIAFKDDGYLKYLGLHYVFNKALLELAKYHIAITKSERSELWHYTKELLKED
jgi:hypothetical protein